MRAPLVGALAVFALLGASGIAFAREIRIYAVGASQMAGLGVESWQAWPAQLERMLVAKGYKVTIVVSARSGDTSLAILGRVSYAPAGTDVVIFDTGGSNDRGKGLSEEQRNANIALIESRIRSLGAKPIRARHVGFGRELLQFDGTHLNEAGHKKVATALLPQVIAAARKPK